MKKDYLYDMKVTNIQISNVKEYKKYKGAYASIFRILNADSIFVQRYETEQSIGFVDGTYFLQLEGYLDCREYEMISKLKNVKIK
jgi:hypothetical protein